MKQKRIILGRKLLSFMITLAMVLGLMPGMSLTAYAATLDNESTIWSENSVIAGDVTINNNITVNADITLTIPEGKTLTINGQSDYDSYAVIYCDNNSILTVSGGGTLIVNAPAEDGDHPPIDGIWGNLIVDGATVQVTGRADGVYGNVTVNSGSVCVNGGNGEAGGEGYPGISGVVIVNGGSITVVGGNGGNGYNYDNGGDGGYGVCGNIIVNGGSATITGGNGGTKGSDAYAYNGNFGQAVYGSITGNAEESEDNTNWTSVTDNTSSKQYIKFEPILVTGVSLNETTTQTIDIDGTVAFTATVAPDGATDKTVKWSTTGGVTLYSDENCTAGNEIGADATSTLTVYAKGTAAGSATVTATSNADSTKSASCNVTVNAGNTTISYASLKNSTTEITFDGKPWYLIDYDDSTVTLLSKECVGASLFGSENTYDESTVESAVNDYYEESISTDAKTAVSDNKMFLLSTDEADTIHNANPNVLKCSQASDAEENIWWLCSQGGGYYYAAVVNGDTGEVDEYGENLSSELGVRPALKLDLSKVTFDSESNTFSLNSTANTPEYADKLVEITNHETNLGDLGFDDDMAEWGVSITQEEAIALAQYMSAQNNGANCAVFYYVENEYVLFYAKSDGETNSRTSFTNYPLNNYLPGYKVYYVPVADDVNVTIIPGNNMTKTSTSGAASQTGLSGAMNDVVYTADDGYYFPTNYSVVSVNGISVTRDSFTQITVSGTPTANAEITLPAPTAKTTPDAPTTAATTDCTTADNNDGTLTGVTTAMEYKKSDAADWTDGTGSDITGLVPGTYYVRVKATDTTNASANQELTVMSLTAYAAYDVTTETNKTKSGNDLTALQVTFNERQWYIIEDNSTSATEGTVTLLAADNSFGVSVFSNDDSNNAYSSSKIKATLDAMTQEGGAFADVADAIVSTDLGDVSVTGAKLYLLSTSEAQNLNSTILNYNFPDSYMEGAWWLRSPGLMVEDAACVRGEHGDVYGSGYSMGSPLGVRPALQLDLSKVTFDSNTKIFELMPVVEYPLWVGGVQVTSANKDDVLGDTDEGATVSYDVDTNTLTLNGVDIAEGYEDPYYNSTRGIYYSGNDGGNDSLSIVLSTDSDNKVGVTGNVQTGIESSRKITISGAGKLTVKGSGNYSVGIKAYALTIKDAEINVEGAFNGIQTDKYGYGVNIISGKVNAIGQTGTGIHSGLRDANYQTSAVTIGENATVVAIGGNTAINYLKNAIAGTGWTDPEDNTSKTTISISSEGQSIDTLKKMAFPKLPASTVTTPPEANNLTFTGSAQELVTAGVASNGEMQYAIGTNMTTAPTSGWGTSIPAKTDAGTYYVWYKVVGDGNHSDSVPAYVTSTIRGKISQTVTFKVINGSWDDGTTADKTVNLNGYEGDTLKLAASDIPAVGKKPGVAYEAGSWDVTPNTETAITAATTYTYSYVQKDSISQTVTFKVINGSWDDGSTADKTVTLNGYEGDTLKLTSTDIPAVGKKPGVAYEAGSWDVTPNTETAITAATTYTYSYVQKDSISQTVTFKVINGSWDDGSTADKTVTLNGYEGDTLKLTSTDIPAVGNKPNDTYKPGGWDVTPNTETAITAATTYIYSYVQKDSISQTVTFKVINGSWDDGTTADKTVNLNCYEGDTLKLTATDIPAVGNKPSDAHEAGSWDVTPDTETAITAATTYIYIYVHKESVEGEVSFNKGEGSDETPKTVVESVESSDLAEFAETQKEESKEVKVELEITPKKEADIVQTSVDGTKQIAEGLFVGFDTKKVVTEYFDIDLTKYVDDVKQDNIADTGSPIEIALKYDKTKMFDPVVVRTHNGETVEFSKLNARPAKADYKDATYYVGDGVIYIYSRYFSDYAIIYTTVKTYNVDIVTGTGADLSKNVAEGSKVDLPTGLSKSGYTFGGWFSDEACTKVWNVNDTVTADIKIYALWIQNTVPYVPSPPVETPTTTPTPTVTPVPTVVPTVTPAPVKDSITAEEAAKGAIKINSGLKVYPKNSDIVVKWGKVDNADRYVIYAAYCKKGRKCAKIATLDGDANTYIFSELNGKAINTKKNIKLYVVAYRKVNGKYKKITSSITAHIVGSGSKKYSNVKGINVESTKITLSLDDNTDIPSSYTLNPVAVLKDSLKKMLIHTAEFRYATSKSSVATVGKDGTITAKGIGTCYIYVYAQNGYAKRIKVTVK